MIYIYTEREREHNEIERYIYRERDREKAPACIPLSGSTSRPPEPRAHRAEGRTCTPIQVSAALKGKV